jgi:hypothetical protein
MTTNLHFSICTSIATDNISPVTQISGIKRIVIADNSVFVADSQGDPIIMTCIYFKAYFAGLIAFLL